jgi:hypothetical protein
VLARLPAAGAMAGKPPSLQLELPVVGPFSLQASTRFLEGFAPAGSHAGGGEGLALAFPVEGDWRTAGAVVRQSGEVPSRSRCKSQAAGCLW